MKPKLLIVTTVPETLSVILRGQPKQLSEYFDTSVATSLGIHLPDVEVSEGFKVYEFGQRSDGGSDRRELHSRCFVVSMNRGISPLADLKSIWFMLKVVRLYKPDIIHSYTPKAGLVAMIAGWLCNVSVRIHTFTGLIFPTTAGRLKRSLLLYVDSLICACATTVVAEGQGVRRDLVGFKVTPKMVHIVGHGNIAGIDTAYFDPLLPEVVEKADLMRSSLNASFGEPADSMPDSTSDLSVDLNLSLNRFIFLFVGRLNKDKGLNELVEAFSSLHGSAELLIVGALDETAPPDPLTLQAIHRHPHIHHLGFMSDIRPVLLCCDVFVLPSYREGFPNVLLQAGAMQKPVIATDINGSNEIVLTESGHLTGEGRGPTGWLVPPKNTFALESAMKIAMQTPLRVRQQMGMTARQNIQALYERQGYIQTLIRFYRAQLNHETPV